MSDDERDDTQWAVGYDETLALVFDEIHPDRVTAHIDPDDRHSQPYGIVHGGVYCSIVESLGSVGSALYAQSIGMAGAVGLSNSTDFFRSHRDGRLSAEATPVHQGRTQQVWQVEIRRDADHKLVARGQLRTYNLSSVDAIGGGIVPAPTAVDR